MQLRDTRAGARASAAWLAARGLHLHPSTRWEVTIALAAAESTFQIGIGTKEWSFAFRHGGKTSAIRVIDVPVIHEHDQFGLLPKVPPLRSIGDLLHAMEDKHRIEFRRPQATITTTIAGAAPKILTWVVASI